MRAFALLGLDTGFDAGEAAGESFERPFRSAARILKSMWFIIRKDLRVGAQEHLTWPYLASTLSFVIVPLRDLAPAVLLWWYSRATPADSFLLGPSGYGYAYPARMGPEDQAVFANATVAAAAALGG